MRNGVASFLSLERNVLTMSITGLLINLGMQSFQPFIPLYLRSLQADITQIGVVFVAIQLAATLVSIPGGILADKLGRKLVIVIGNGFGFGLYYLLLGASNWIMALVILFASTIFATLVQPAYSSIVAESVGMEERSRAFGSFLFFIYLGLAVGAVLGGFFSFTVNILIVATAGVFAALIRLGLLRETLPRETRESQHEEQGKFFVAHLSRNVWLLLLALLVFNFSSALGQPLYAIFSTDILHLDKAELGVMVGVGYLASMFGAFLAGRVSRKLGVENMMAVSILLSSLLLIPWLYSPTAVLAIAIFSASGFFAQFFFVGNQALMANITKPRERASVIGLITTAAGFGGIVGPYVGTQLWLLLAPRTPFLISSLLAVAVVAPIALIREAPSEVKCPHCGRGLPPEPRFCDMCGKPFASKKCEACGRDLVVEAKFCDVCGIKQAEPRRTETDSQPDHSP